MFFLKEKSDFVMFHFYLQLFWNSTVDLWYLKDKLLIPKIKLFYLEYSLFQYFLKILKNEMTVSSPYFESTHKTAVGIFF